MDISIYWDSTRSLNYNLDLIDGTRTDFEINKTVPVAKDEFLGPYLISSYFPLIKVS